MTDAFKPTLDSGDESLLTTPDLSIIVVNYNTSYLLPRLRESLEKSVGSISWRLIIIDNASRDDSVATLIREFPSSILITNEVNVGFGRANNQALPHLTGRYVLLLNTDAFMAPETLRLTIDYMDRNPDIGILGARLVGSDGELQPSCRYFPNPINSFAGRVGLKRLLPRLKLIDDMEWDHSSPRDCDWVPGCYYLVRRTVIDRVGLFDPRFFMYYEEVDHCHRVKDVGWRVVYYPHTTVVHLGGESAKTAASVTSTGRQISALQVESEHLYVRKHFGIAGMLLNGLLNILLVVWVVIRQLLHRRRLLELRPLLAHQRHFWRLFTATCWGSRPTR